MEKDLTRYYVYVLVDPRTGVPFYVGKGSGDRATRHLWNERTQRENRKKHHFIKGLRNKGLEPVVEKWQIQLMEEEAYRLEAELISMMGRKDIDEDGVLLNLCIDHRPPINRGKKFSEERRKALSAARMGKNNPMFGRTWSRKKREEMVKRMSGEHNPFFGRTHDDAMIRKILETKRERGYFDVPSPLKGRRRDDLATMFAELWLVTTPTGETVEVRNLCEYAKEVAKCHPESLRKSATYKSGKTKGGWRAVKISGRDTSIPVKRPSSPRPK